MADRANRDRLIKEIQNFLNHKTNSFDFDYNIDQIAKSSNDKTVKIARRYLWYFYDDIKEHKASLNKADWDVIWRLMLILHSNKSLSSKREFNYSITQLIALGYLLILAIYYFIFGFNYQFLLFYFFGSILAIFLYYKKEEQKIDYSIYPFNSITEILQLKRAYKEFKKPKFNKELEEVKIRNKSEKALLDISFWLFAILFSPIILLIYSLPWRTLIVKVENEKK